MTDEISNETPEQESVVEEKKAEGVEAPVEEKQSASLESILGELSTALEAKTAAYEKLSSEHSALLEATKKMVLNGGASFTSEGQSNSKKESPETSAQKLPEILSQEDLTKLFFGK